MRLSYILLSLSLKHQDFSCGAAKIVCHFCESDFLLTDETYWCWISSGLLIRYLRQRQSDLQRWSFKDTELKIWRRQAKFWFQLYCSVGALRDFQMLGFIPQQAQWFWSLGCLLCWISTALGNLMKLPSFYHAFLGCSNVAFERQTFIKYLMLRTHARVQSFSLKVKPFLATSTKNEQN